MLLLLSAPVLVALLPVLWLLLLGWPLVAVAFAAFGLLCPVLRRNGVGARVLGVRRMAVLKGCGADCFCLLCVRGNRQGRGAPFLLHLFGYVEGDIHRVRFADPLGGVRCRLVRSGGMLPFSGCDGCGLGLCGAVSLRPWLAPAAVLRP
jgi:hypothetical protein